jgi:UDP-N-acetylglucosamine transferase subunit ALG13
MALATPFVFVTVGTDYHSFDRLVALMDRWAATRNVPPSRCFVQYGSSRPPEHCHGEAFLSHDKLGQVMAVANVVVCHGGPATIAQAQAAGIRPICVPRDPKRNEHVDEHQLRFARRVAEHEGIVLAAEEGPLYRALDHALSDPSSVAMPLGNSSTANRASAVHQVGGLIEDLLARGARARRAR